MATITHDDIEICHDCAVMIEYGDLTADGAEERWDAGFARWGDLIGGFTNADQYDEDGDATDGDQHAFRCDFCGEDVLTWSHQYVIFAR
jgi:hypothetical protein